MNCPSELSTIIAKMMRMAILRIRALGWADQGDRCAIEADHVHDLPDLIADYSPERLDYYWGCQRLSYLARLSVQERAEWEDLWDQMRNYVKTNSEKVLNR